MLLGDPVGALRDREVPLVLLDVRLDLVEAEIGGVPGLDRLLDRDVELGDLREHCLGVRPRCPDLCRLGDSGAGSHEGRYKNGERHREPTLFRVSPHYPPYRMRNLVWISLCTSGANYQPHRTQVK